NEQRRKIRESCNNCSAQKIRCAKQRPSCARCSSKGLECNYSYSQRTGRRASSSNTQRDQPGSTSLLATANSPTAIGDPRSLFGIQKSMTPTMSPRVAQTSTYPAASPNDAYLNIFDDSSFLPAFSMIDDTTSLSSVSNNASETEDPILSLELSSSYIDPNNQWQDVLSAVSTRTQGALKPALEQDQTETSIHPPDKAYQRGHDCMALALRVVYNLNVMREPCHIATSDPMAYIQSSENEARDVDTVLFHNRDAAQTIKKILDCSCSTDSTVTLACYLAATKIVDWYGAAIGAAGEPSGEEACSNTALDHNSVRRAMVDRIIARPIFMGRYCLDPEVQRAVRAQVVLSELKEHVQPLISRLPKYYVSGFDAGDESSFSKGLNGNQSCVLRNQLRAVIQTARN
ncbi:hypothetical protein K505DRAFT_195049, partial [Melanomma pulvis-pyrius CBS 109.77]